MTVLTNFFINQPQVQHFCYSTLQMLSIHPGSQTCIVPASQTAKLTWRDWFCSMPPGICASWKQNRLILDSQGEQERNNCTVPVVLLLCWVYLLLEILHEVEGLCCDVAKLDGSQAVQWLLNPHDVPELTHSGANPSACSDCYKLI